MAVAQVYSAIPNDIITAARWNNEFGNIYNNGTDIAFPLLKSVSLGGFVLTLDTNGVTSLNSTSSTGISYTPGVKSGVPTLVGKVWNTLSSTFTDTNTAASGTSVANAFTSFQLPTLAASNVTVTCTDAATVYIAGAPVNGTNITITNPWALWVDSGNVRFDGGLTLTSTFNAQGSATVQGELAAGINPWRFTATVAANALTITLQTNTGATPSVATPIPIPFRNATLTTPQLTTVLATAATSVVISSGSTLNTVANTAARLYIVAINNAGTVELAVYNPLDVATGPPATAFLKGIDESILVSTTAEGGAGAADSAQILYSTVARTNVCCKILGYIEITEAVAGTWATAPTVIQMMGPGVNKTGVEVQHKVSFTGALATGSTVLPFDDTVPQNTEGDQYMTLAITPTSALNRLLIEIVGHFGQTANIGLGLALFQDSVVNAIASSGSPAMSGIVANQNVQARLYWEMNAGVVTSTTFKVRCGPQAAGTTSFNGANAVRVYGGNLVSMFKITEIFI